ncbi:TonB-dependent receptor [Membranicola marinus]|uniref:TonB-dependent receptor n=1 Tax=Membranihabitans marinus TaxID=1227546 RepID=A0A953HQN3_9BACT|nr:TonB-dependent receptor [Membranihabitans marinus]MBY5959479.1 TonB-dependent receptor [Membranihabitans marinus]
MYKIFTESRKRKFLMRISFIYVFLLVSGIQILSASNSRAQGLEDIMVTIEFEERNLEYLLKRIELQTDLTFAYLPAEVKKYRRITIRSGKQSVKSALDYALKSTNLSYRYIENSIIIFPRSENSGDDPRRDRSAKTNEVYVPSTFSNRNNTVVDHLTTNRFPALSSKRLARTISGQVTDVNGEPLIGVNVQVKGTGKGTATDFDGRFLLEDMDDQAVLVISYIGYKTREVIVGGQTNMTIVLEEDAQTLDEVVVVGYGTQKKVNLTGAVESVGEEVFENRSVSNTTQALQGAIPNLNIFLEDGKPTRSASFNVRGQTSIGQGGSALVLIDGVEGDPSFLNPNDIKSVSVLKDAASAAIYGSRGSFGVVLITTKNPEKGRTTVSYSGNVSSQSLAKKPEFVTDGVTWLEHFRLAYVNTQGTVPTSINNNNQYYSDEWLERMRAWKAAGGEPKTEILPNGNYEYYSNTDWMGMLFKDQTLAYDHNLTVSGGNDKTGFYLSGRMYDFGGIYNFNPDEYRSYNIRGKGSLEAFEWLKVSNNIEYSNNFYHQPYSGAGRVANVQRYIEVTGFPTQPLYNPDGTYTRGGAYTLAGMIDGNNYQDNRKNLFKNSLSLNSSFFNNTFRINGDFTLRYNDRNYFWKRVKVPYYQNANRENPSYIGDINGTIYEWLGNTMYTASNMFTEYENTFSKKHYVKAMAGWNYETSAYKANSIQRNQLLLENAESVQLATGSSIVPGASVSRWKTAGAFFRLNYGYQDRYLVEVNGRYDGSSRFPVNQQWGFFPSISAGWRISEESFWTVSDRIISDIKLRASYGSLGNGNISPYQFLELLSIGNSGRVLDGDLNKKTSAPAPIPSGLTWEKATTSDIGIDFGMLRGKLRFNGDYYIRKTTDMYVAGPTLPEIFGASSPKGNYADMTTKGFELTLSWRDELNVANKPFNYQIRATLYDYVSRIDKFNNPTKKISDFYDGKIIGELWGFRTDGLFQEDPEPEEYINTIFKSSADAVWRAGDLKISNLDGSSDNMITKGQQTVDNPGDLTIIGNTEPRYQYSVSLSADWKGIFISAFIHGVGRQDWYPGKESAFWGQYNRGYNQMPAWHLGNFWTEDNRDAYLPRYAQYNGAVAFSGNVPNDRYLQKVSYTRLKNLQIGYALPDVWMTRLQVRSAQVYLSGENVASWSPLYKRVKNYMDVSSAVGNTDSDLRSTYNQGAGNGYPLLKSISFGLSVTF